MVDQQTVAEGNRPRACPRSLHTALRALQAERETLEGVWLQLAEVAEPDFPGELLRDAGTLRMSVALERDLLVRDTCERSDVVVVVDVPSFDALT